MSLLDDEFLTVAEVAEILKLNPQTVRNWIDQGTLPALRVGRRVRIRRSEFERFVEQGRIQEPHPSGRSPAQDFWDGDVPLPDAPPETG